MERSIMCKRIAMIMLQSRIDRQDEMINKRDDMIEKLTNALIDKE